ncbi:MAG: serine/threonine protein kinase [Proteobacteria bacterium]|nr:serine/threonine protein kinase [Pseudomonadota bacterium]
MVKPDNWDRVESFVATIAEASPDATILPETQTGMATADGRALTELAALGQEASLSARLEVLGTLGEGGMGIVRLGRQVALHREVAIKELIDARRGKARSVLKLMQEAWTAGSLEHPNIVPIYDIEVQADGDPRIVMKRIQGKAWSDLIDEADAVAETFGETDLLKWNLDVLMQVANAVRYAHDRGIVHLDLKPSNVMLGSFGEVYLVDWGLGMSLDADAGGRLQRTVDVDDIIGTPSYLAPEMIARDGSKLSEQTDVFLLGAVLHRILTGKPPHQGDSLLAIFFQAATSSPTLPEEVPAELRAIGDKAMAMEPSDRHASADEFRLAIRDFLEHRGSIALSDGAAVPLADLRDAVGDEDRRDEIHRAFNEARFGFRQALAAWSGNEDAVAGLRASTIAMIEHELAVGAAPAAATLLAELHDAPADLRARVDAELARFASEGERIKKLEALGEDMDLSIGRRTRLFVLSMLGLLFIAWPIYSASCGGPPTYEDQFTGPILFLVTALALGWGTRESMSRTLVNQRLFAVIIVLLVAQVALTGLCWYHGLNQLAFGSMLFFLWSVCAVFATLLIERRLWPTASGQMIALAVITLDHGYVYMAIVLTNIVFVINIAIIWWPGRITGTYDGDARIR